jgi:hypothetical protein
MAGLGLYGIGWARTERVMVRVHLRIDEQFSIEFELSLFHLPVARDCCVGVVLF